MKYIIFFDMDNTIFNTKKEIIMPQTKRLLFELSQNPNVLLGLATGRGPKHLNVIENVKDLFQYKIFMNGALAYDNEKIIYENAIPSNVVEKVLKLADELKVAVGLITKDGEYITFYDDEVKEAMKGFDQNAPEIYETVHYDKAVYQVWLFSEDKSKLEQFTSISKKIRTYYWNQGGLDLVLNDTNKMITIKKIISNQEPYTLIAVGDGVNDIEMIEKSDIGIAMGNSKSSILKEKAKIVAPNIEEDKLYEVFVKLGILSL